MCDQGTFRPSRQSRFWMVVLLFGILRGGCTGGIMALPSQVLRPECRGIGLAIGTAISYVFMAVFSSIAGYLLDVTADPAAPLWFAALAWLLILIMLGSFKILQRKWIPQG